MRCDLTDTHTDRQTDRQTDMTTTVTLAAHARRGLIRLENRLEEMERSNPIPSRWLPTDEEYKKSEYAVLLTKKEQILMQIWKSGQSRLFLLQLKRRYAGMWKL